VIADDEVRALVTNIREPHRLDTTAARRLLEAYGVMPTEPSTLNVGRATRALLIQKIDSLKADLSEGGTAQMPYRVLKTCFVDGVPQDKAVKDLALSPRQLTRERGAAIALLRDALVAVPLWLRMAPEGLPASDDVVPRVELLQELVGALDRRRRVAVVGAPHTGKTTLVAMYARAATFEAVFWQTFRSGVNVTLGALLFELGNQLAREGDHSLMNYVTDALPRPDMGIATRLALQALDNGKNRLFVLDHYELAEQVREIASFIDEVVMRLETVRVVTIGIADPHAPAVHVPALVIPPKLARRRDG
jgi:hypothetical protein